eukprot:6471734-Amphidinium_carterae.1
MAIPKTPHSLILGYNPWNQQKRLHRRLINSVPSGMKLVAYRSRCCIMPACSPHVELCALFFGTHWGLHVLSHTGLCRSNCFNSEGVAKRNGIAIWSDILGLTRAS